MGSFHLLLDGRGALGSARFPGLDDATMTRSTISPPASDPGDVVMREYGFTRERRMSESPGRPRQEGSIGTMIRLKRVYEKPTRMDGSRILVDRLWPRGLTKERAAVTLWLKDVAPSTELRKWFGHAPARL